MPLVAAAILAVLPGYRIGAALNVLASLVSLLFALTLLLDRPATGAYLLVDDLNIVFILLNTFVGFTTSAFSACYIGHELETGRLTPIHLRFLPRDVPAHAVRHEPGAARQQHRPDVGRGRTRDADHGDDGRHLPHRRSAGGGVEILHPRQRRHRAGAVRHHPGLSRRPAGGRRGPGRDGLDQPAASAPPPSIPPC